MCSYYFQFHYTDSIRVDSYVIIGWIPNDWFYPIINLYSNILYTFNKIRTVGRHSAIIIMFYDINMLMYQNCASVLCILH